MATATVHEWRADATGVMRLMAISGEEAPAAQATAPLPPHVAAGADNYTATPSLPDRLENRIPAQGTAETVQDTVLGKVMRGGIVERVLFVPEADVAGDGTDFRTFRVINTGQAGVGTTYVAGWSTGSVLIGGLTAFVPAVCSNTETAADLAVVAGDVLVFTETVDGLGVAHGGGWVVVEIRVTA